MVRSRLDPATINLLKLIEIVLKPRPSNAEEVFLAWKVCIFTGEKDGNEVRDVIRMEVGIEQEVNVMIRHPDIEHPP
jgi:hypothetical protein